MTITLDLNDLRPLENNPRTHPPEERELLERVLRQIGPARSGVIDEEGTILAGNGTREALAATGITRVRVVDAGPDEWVVVRKTGLTPEQKRLLAYYDNRASDLAGWAAEAIISDVAAGLDLPAAGVFDAQAVEQFIHEASRAAREAYLFLPEQQQPAPSDARADAASAAPAQATTGPAARGQAAAAAGYPLAIVLTRAELEQWEQFKKSIGVAVDKTAFLRLLAAAMAAGEG